MLIGIPEGLALFDDLVVPVRVDTPLLDWVPDDVPLLLLLAERVSVEDTLSVLDEVVVDVPLADEVPVLEADEVPVCVLEDVTVFVMRAVDVCVALDMLEVVSFKDQEHIAEKVDVELSRVDGVPLLVLNEE